MKRGRWILAGILTLSVLARIVVAVYLGDVVDAPALLTDQRSYHALGARLIGGHGFSFDVDWYPFTPRDTPTSHWSFLYSIFVAGVYAGFGAHPLAARLAQALLGGVLLPWMAFRLTRRLFSDPAAVSAREDSVSGRDGSTRLTRAEILALMSAVLVAIYAYFVLYAATLMTETFYMTALLWSLERALAMRERLANGHMISVGLALTLGLSLGIAVLLRQSILPWVLVLFVWLFWVGQHMGHSRNATRALALAILPIILLVLPFTLRNYQVYGIPLLLNSNAGYAMYSAQHPMHGVDFQEFAAAPIPDELGRLNEAQLDRELMRRGIGFVTADPGRYLLLCLSRVRAYFDFRPGTATTLLNGIGRLLSFGIFVPFMIYGVLLALRETNASLRARAVTRQPDRSRIGQTRTRTLADFLATPLALILMFAFFYSILHILTWAMPRYRLPVDAVLLPFAALAIYDLALRTHWGRSLLEVRHDFRLRRSA